MKVLENSTIAGCCECARRSRVGPVALFVVLNSMAEQSSRAADEPPTSCGTRSRRRSSGAGPTSSSSPSCLATPAWKPLAATPGPAQKTAHARLTSSSSTSSPRSSRSAAADGLFGLILAGPQAHPARVSQRRRRRSKRRFACPACRPTGRSMMFGTSSRAGVVRLRCVLRSARQSGK